MKKTLLIFSFILIVISCKEPNKIILEKETTSPVSLKELDSIVSKTNIEIKNYLTNKEFALQNNQINSEQWKYKNNEDIVQFNGKGILLFMTSNKKSYDTLVVQLKDSNYKYSGKTEKNGIEVDSYTKDNQTIFLSTILHSEKNINVYSITLIKTQSIK